MQVKPILQGIKNKILKDEKIEALASKRIAICNLCEHKKVNRCGICGCFIEFKVRQTIQSCPLKRW